MLLTTWKEKPEGTPFADKKMPLEMSGSPKYREGSFQIRQLGHFVGTREVLA